MEKERRKGIRFLTILQNSLNYSYGVIEVVSLLKYGQGMGRHPFLLYRQ